MHSRRKLTSRDRSSPPGLEPEVPLRRPSHDDSGDSAPELADPSGDEGNGYDSDDEPIETGYAGIELAVSDPVERSVLGGPGSSLAPEEMGQHALIDAAQQASTDAPTQLGELDDEGLVEDEDEESERVGAEDRELDLTDNVLREESLFDIPLEDGRVRAPRVKANEVDVGLERDERARRSTDRVSTSARKVPGRSR